MLNTLDLRPSAFGKECRRRLPKPTRVRCRRVAWVVGLTAVVGLLAPSAAGAHATSTDHWDVPVVIVRDETGATEVRSSLERSVADWNGATPTVQLRIEPGTGTGCVRAAGEIRVCLTRSDGYAGETTTSHDGSHITSATVLIDGIRSGRHLGAVVCHELGHALGLDHRDDGSTCMRPAPTVTTPDQADRDAVRDAHAPDCSKRSLITHNGRCLLTSP